MKKFSVKKLALAGMFCALCVVGSVFSFPMFGSKCAPVQHMVNVLCAVLLGPWYGVGAAFVASLLRNLLGDADTVYSGYESLRVRRIRSGDALYFAPHATRYTYAYPRSFYLTISYKF